MPSTKTARASLSQGWARHRPVATRADAPRLGHGAGPALTSKPFQGAFPVGPDRHPGPDSPPARLVIALHALRSGHLPCQCLAHPRDRRHRCATA
eukprot:scaffold87586_cov32-Tisochrysis_lutea.AAC.9